MLSKVKESINTPIYSQTQSSYTVNSTNITTFTANNAGNLIITAELCLDTNSKSGESHLDLYVNDTVVSTIWASYTYAAYPNWYSRSLKYYVKAGDSVKLLLRATNSNNGAYAQNISVVQEVYNFSVIYHNLTPIKLVNIGDLLVCNLYGVFNNQYNGGLMVEKANSAITWNITPGNFKWYIKVLFNGEYIKIPYYGN